MKCCRKMKPLRFVPCHYLTSGSSLRHDGLASPVCPAPSTRWKVRRTPVSSSNKAPFRCLFAIIICGLLLAVDQPTCRTKAAIAGDRPGCHVLSRRRSCRTAADGSVSRIPTCAAPRDKSAGWTHIFDGRSLSDWKISDFGGEGDVRVEDGKLMLDFGNWLTGVTYAGKFPQSNFEIRLEAMQVDGIDFFCGMTFPVGPSYCSLIVGGWGGSVVGLSNIDDRDASDNATTRYMSFKNGVWYRIRVRVTAQKIEAWIDDEKVVDQVITGHKIGTRPELDPSQPFGIASYDTRAALRNIELRKLKEN